MSTSLIILSAVGIILSLYLYYVEWKVKKEPTHAAVCDISSTISCSAVAKTKYSHVFFGISNTFPGIGFYTLVIILAVLGYFQYIFYLSILSILFSLYLAYLMYFKIKKYCIVCNLVYVVNILIFITSSLLA